MRSTNYLSTASLILGLSSSVVQAQIRPIPEFFNLTTFPKEQTRVCSTQRISIC
ncbi:hypothetical protein QWA68_016720 [Fusarium oxysporum]|nr:hypothetical protein QWA68_016720 [Fusarium oxysporum]